MRKALRVPVRQSGCLVVLFLSIFCAQSASAAVPFCSFGSALGNCNDPAGVAANRSLGRIYVVDHGNNRVNVFDESGDFQFSFGSSGSGNGQFASPTTIAVDNNPTSPAFQDVYVVDGPGRVQRFTSNGAFVSSFGSGVLNSGNDWIAVGPDGTVYVADNFNAQRSIKKFTPVGLSVGSSNVSGGAFVGSLAVDSSGDAYVTRFGNGEPAVQKYELSEPDATLLSSFDAELGPKSIALDAADNVYVAGAVPPRFIAKRDASGALVKRFGYGQIEFNLNGLAVGASGTLFGSEAFVGSPTLGNRVIAIPQPPPGPLPCCQTQIPGNTKAVLKGQVNPEGKATTYHFEYITDADFIANGNSFTGPNAPVKTPESPTIGSDFELYPAEAAIGCPVVSEPPQPECMEPNTLYHVRLVATSADGEINDEATFKTLAPFDIEATFATDVIGGVAQLHATVNPLGVPASAYFEYVDDASFHQSGFASATKVPDVDSGQQPITLGNGNAGKTIAVPISALTPGTTYHYRVKVKDSFVPEGDPEGEGPERTFATFPQSLMAIDDCPNAGFRFGVQVHLPDCRAYEMVSPIDKNGGDVRVGVNGTNYPARLDQSSIDGDSFTYSAVQAFAAPASAPFSSQYLSRRIAGLGWNTTAINPPRESKSLTDKLIKFDAQYKIFSPDLANGWLFQDANPPLEECAPEGFLNLYRRDLQSGKYEALITSAPLASLSLDYRLELQGVSADGTHAVFRANAKLTPNASGADVYQLYEHVAGEGCGQLRLVSVEPNGKVPSPVRNASAGGTPSIPGMYRESTVNRAISADGSRVFFGFGITSLVSEPLLLRVNADQEQSVVSGGKCTEAEKACTLRVSTADAQYWTAATDGSLGIYSAGSELFEYDVAKGIAGEAASSKIAGGFKGVVGASEDATRLYFVSTERIDGEGEEGEPNVFLYQRNEGGADRYRLVATVSSADLGQFPYLGFGIGSPEPIKNGTRLTADGSHLAFVSTASPTGYDNISAEDGRPALEIFIYDADTGKLACVSCNPTDSRPEGRLFSVDLRVAAMMAPGENQTFAPRALTADGNALFFESFESLLPRDVNKTADVYEWQRAANANACEEAGAELYVAKAGGCLSLLSPGQDEVDTEFADASPDGSNVFIRTASSLLPQDPGQVDVYDVRRLGGLPVPPLPGFSCETPQNAATCPGPAPGPPSDQTPASSSGATSGQVPPPKPCPKGKVRKGGKCVKKPKKHKGKHRKGSKRAHHKSGRAAR